MKQRTLKYKGLILSLGLCAMFGHVAYAAPAAITATASKATVSASSASTQKAAQTTTSTNSASASKSSASTSNTAGTSSTTSNSSAAKPAANATTANPASTFNSAPFSNGKNFKSLLSESVDPRTGAVSMTYPLVSVPGRGDMNLNLSLVYNMYSTDNRYGIAQGWSLNLTHEGIDPTTKQPMIYFADGSSYFLQGTTLEYYNLQDVRIVDNGSNGQVLPDNSGRSYRWELLYLNGDQEYLDQNGNLVLKQDRFGNKIQYFYSGTALTKIVDTYGNQYTFNTNSNSGLTTITYNVDGQSVSQQINAEGNSVVFTDAAGNTTTVLSQSNDDGYTVPSSITTSTGVRDAFTYTNLPYNNNEASLPVVSMVQETDLTNNKSLAPIYYSYGLSSSLGTTGHNYLGNPIMTTPGKDPVMQGDNTENSYYYVTSEQVGNKLIKNTYNFLHLLIEEDTFDVSSGSAVELTSETMGYSGEQLVNGQWQEQAAYPGVGLNYPNYQKPAQTLTAYYDLSSDSGDARSVQENETYNNAGQVVSDSITNNGITTTTSYVYDDPSPNEVGVGHYGLPIVKSVETSGTGNNTILVDHYTLTPDNKAVSVESEGEESLATGTPTFEDAVDTAYTYDQYGRILTQLVSPGAEAASFFGLNTNPKPLETQFTYQENTPNPNQETDTTTEYGIGEDGVTQKTVITSKVIDTESGLDLSETDGNGNVTSYTYDAIGRPVTETDPNGTVTKFEYQENNGNTGIINSEKVTFINPKSFANGYMEKETYNGAGAVVAEFDNGTTDDSATGGALTSEPDRELSLNSYNNLGELDSTEDTQTGLTTHYEYDVLARKIKTTNPDGTRDITVYDDYDNTETQYSLGADGVTKSSSTIDTYDNIGNNLHSTIVPDGREDIQSGESAEAAASSPDNITINYTYNGLKQMVGKQFTNNSPLSNADTYTTSDTYNNALGVLSTEVLTDSANNNITTNNQYDYLGNMVQATVSQQIAGNGLTAGNTSEAYGHIYSFNNLGQVEKDSTNDGSLSTTMTYDDDGNELTHTDYEGNVFNSAYDNANHLVESWVQSPTKGRLHDIHYDYDPITGDLLDEYEVGNQAKSELSYSYYPDGVIETVNYANNGQPKTMNYQYDAAGRLSQFTDANGAVSTYTYNNFGQLSQVSIADNGVSASVSYTYDTLGRPEEVSRSNGVNTSYTYDNFGRVSEMQTVSANNNNLLIQDLQYTYDSLGNVIKEVSTSAADPTSSGNYTETYTYDLSNRLIQSVLSPQGTNAGQAVTTTYNFDAYGNVLSTTAGGATTPYQYDSVTGELLSAGEVPIKYDQNGNMVVDHQGNTYQYNSLKQLISYTSKATGLTTTYTYYPNGDRSSKSQTVNGVTTTIYFYYDDEGNMVDEFDNSNDSTSYLMGYSREARLLTTP